VASVVTKGAAETNGETNVTFCSARHNFKTCDFTPGAVTMNRLIQHCRRATSESVRDCVSLFLI